MAIEPLSNTAPVREPVAARRRSSETGAAGGGDGFSLPEGKEAGTQGSDKPARADGKPGREPAARPGSGSRPVQPDSAAGPLAELLAAAQGRFAPSEEGGAPDTVATDVPGEKDAAVKTGAETTGKPHKKPKASNAADEAAGDGQAGEAAIAVQKPAPQPVSAIVTLALPVAGTADGEAAQKNPEAKGGAVPGAARAQAPGVSLAAAGPGVPARAVAGGAKVAETVKTTGAASAPAEEAHKATDADAADSVGAAKEPAKADAGQAGPAAAGEAKPSDPLQQALAPIDLGALVQQASGKSEPPRLLSPLDPGAPAAPNPPPPPGQGAAAALPATPLHVVPIEIGLRALSGAKQFDIRLDPDELGRVDVNLSISDKGEVSARLVVDRVETLHLLQRDARTLERAFEQAGLKPSDGGVDISLRDPPDQSFRQHRQQEEAPQRPRQTSFSETGDDSVLPVTPVPQRRLVRLGGVDLSI